MSVAYVVVVDLKAKKARLEFSCSRETAFVRMGEAALGATEFQSPGAYLSFKTMSEDVRYGYV